MGRDIKTSSNYPNTGHNMKITTTTIRSSEEYTQVAYANDTSRHKNNSCISIKGNNKLTQLNTKGSNVTYTQGDHILDANNISSHIHYFVNNKINTSSTSGTSDNYTQRDYAKDMGRHI
jgi:hypothetical protein